MVRHMPPEDMADLRRRLASAPSYTKAGVDRMLPLPERRLQGGKKGSGVVAIKPSRRNRKKKHTKNWPKLGARLQAYIRMGWLPNQPIPKIVFVMRMGVKINGRPWPGGSFCQYTKDTRANRGQGHMGKIVSYFTFENELPTFVLIDAHHVTDQKGVMYVVNVERYDQHVVHIDCLTFCTTSLRLMSAKTLLSSASFRWPLLIRRPSTCRWHYHCNNSFNWSLMLLSAS